MSQTQPRKRNKAIRMVRVSELEDAPWNFRTHPDEQRGALEGVIDEIGFYGYPDVYETEEGRLRICDGHLRKDLLIAKYGPDTEIEVNVTDFDEVEAKKATLTHDPLAAMAEADDQKLGELLAQVETEGEALRAMLDGLAEEHGVDVFQPGAVDMPDLPSGDREPFQQMTFTLSDDQAGTIKRAVAAAKDAGPFIDSPNENSNGNALARVAEAYIGQG